SHRLQTPVHGTPVPPRPGVAPEVAAPAAGPDRKVRIAAIASAAALGITLVARLATAGVEDSKAARDPAAAVAELPPNFACDVTGVMETVNNEGSATLRDPLPAGRHNIVIGNAGRTVAAVASATNPNAVNFNAYGLHNGTVGVAIGGVTCRGTFNLGKPGPGDENFVTS
ncbi:MAG TPA: hypothetical protein VLF62_03440, partial [Candidatus Saccharimonadales bacterium]|nr:hypothetical protein [Candidatus Saccharimonadales bacterium]